MEINALYEPILNVCNRKCSLSLFQAPSIFYDMWLLHVKTPQTAEGFRSFAGRLSDV